MPQARWAPSPRWGEGWGERAQPSRQLINPSPGELRSPTSPQGRGEAEYAARAVYFFSSARRTQVIAFGWHAMPTFEQTGSAPSERWQVRQLSVHSWQVLSLSP